MLIGIASYYGGPLDGKRWRVDRDIPRGDTVKVEGTVYIFDGAGRYVYAGTQEGAILLAEFESEQWRG